jgi:hypothetical protein
VGIDALPEQRIAFHAVRHAKEHRGAANIRAIGGMGMLRFDHVGVVVDDLDNVAAFFLALGFKLEGRGLVEGETVDKINGLEGVRAELVFVRTPDGSGKLELAKYHEPTGNQTAHNGF